MNKKENSFCLKIIDEVIGKANKLYDKQMARRKPFSVFSIHDCLFIEIASIEARIHRNPTISINVKRIPIMK